MPRARLPYVVECKSVLPFYEAIAAFDHPTAALRYLSLLQISHRNANKGNHAMPCTMESTVYKFGELSDRAKEKVRAWWRSGECDTYWPESVLDDAIECGSILGIEIDRGDGVSSLRSKIYWSGFSSQGDGACFEGRYSYAKGAAKKIRAHAPANAAGGQGPRDLNAMLHSIADDLQAIQRQFRYRVTARAKHRGHSYHSGCMDVEVFYAAHGAALAAETEEQVTACLRRFADWIYRQLEAEYNYRMSDENVDESIVANEYEFNADGSRARDY